MSEERGATMRLGGDRRGGMRRIARRLASAVSLATAGAVAGCADRAPTPEQNATTVDSTRGDAVRGRAILAAFRDSLPEHSGNALRCTTCHLDDGRRANAMPWLGTAARYPRYRGRRGSEETIEQRVNECIARSLAGRVVDERSREMRDMVAYLESLRNEARPAGPDTIRLAGRSSAGRRVYAASCARCHGAGGEGGVAPPLWGAASYSVGAGLARQTVLATFVRENMPYDHADTLTAQEAADVAAWVLAQPRQDHPGKERDWPKGDPPADVAYETTAATAAGKRPPPPRPLLPRRLAPTP